MKTLDKIINGIVTCATIGILTFSNISCKDIRRTNYMERDGHYPGIVIFAYETEENKLQNSEMLERFEELTIGAKRLGYEELNNYNLSIEDWYKKEAQKYNQSIDIPLSLYSQQIKVPQEYITDDKNSIDLERFVKYLSKNYPETNDYDFVSILYRDSNSERDKFRGIARQDLSAFFVRNPYPIDLFYIKSISKIMNKAYAHEFAHLLGAIDKYGDFDKDDIYDYNDIMKSTNTKTIFYQGQFLSGNLLEKEIIVSEPTAEEIGWKKKD